MDQRPFGRTTALRRPPKRAESGGFMPLGNLALRIASLALCAALVAALARASLPSEANDFWNTTGYVEASPNAAESDTSGFTSFTTNERSSDALEGVFRSTRRKGTVLIVR